MHMLAHAHTHTHTHTHMHVHTHTHTPVNWSNFKITAFYWYAGHRLNASGPCLMCQMQMFVCNDQHGWLCKTLTDTLADITTALLSCGEVMATRETLRLQAVWLILPNGTIIALVVCHVAVLTSIADSCHNQSSASQCLLVTVQPVRLNYLKRTWFIAWLCVWVLTLCCGFDAVSRRE